MINSKLHWIFVLVTFAFVSACSPTENKTLVTAIEAEPADFSLSNTRPEIYDFEIAAENKGTFAFAFELTYFENQMQGWDALPLYYSLKHPDGKEEDYRFSLALKDEKGEWKGELKENNVDRVTEQTIKDALSLTSGKYQLKLFGDSKDLSKPILGIVRVTFKLYQK